MGQKLTTEEFIAKAKAVHGDKYDYSKVEYVNSKTNVIIICPKHGEFEKRPSHHLEGSGCPRCSIQSRISNPKDIIDRLRLIFGTRYSYEKVMYKNMKTPITLVCHEQDANGIEHGEFSLRPDNIFFSKQGCPKCYDDRRGVALRKSVETFIEEAKKVHGELYEYHKVEYINAQTDVCFVCKIHGDFWQTPTGHLAGHGCPYCSGNAKKWNKETCEQEARKYEYIFDFRVRSGGACNMAQRMGWLKDYTWLKKKPPKPNDYDRSSKYIYSYEFVEQKAVYVGLTNSLIRRDWQHCNSQDSSVNRFSVICNCNIPSPIKLEESVPIHASGKREKYWVNYYKKQGWTILNRAKTGERESAVGVYYPIKWNKKTIREKANECNFNLSLFTERYPGAKPTDGMFRRVKTIEEAWAISQYYESIADLSNHAKIAYRLLKGAGLLQKRYPNSVRKAVLQYSLDGKFIKEWPNAYAASRCLGMNINGLIGLVCKGKKKSAGGYIWKYKEERNEQTSNT